MPVYDRRAGTGQLLVADLDVGRARALGVADPAGRVAAEAAAVIALVERCGGGAFADVSPSGGRHVYVLFAQPVEWTRLREVALALARRFPTMDAAPMSGPAGQIRPPGAPHRIVGGRLSGYMRLTVPLQTAVALYGASGFDTANPLQRYWRDIAVGSRHPHLRNYLAMERLGSALADRHTGQRVTTAG